MKFTAIYPLVAIVAISSCQTTQSELPARAQRIDTDRDGRISHNELSDSLVTTLFNSRDSNRDGKMTKQEWEVPGSEDSTKFEDWDVNSDGVVTLDEAIQYGRSNGVLANELMKEADIDKDGYLGAAEIQAYYEKAEGPLP